MSLERVIAVAEGEVGYTESPPNSNCTKYWQEYDPSFQGQPWCVAFLWWVFNHAGESTAFFGGAKTASCRTLLQWYRAQGQTVSPEVIEPGDIVIMNFSGKRGNDGNLDTEHCGIVTDKINDAGWWHTVEGNTTPGLEGSQDNGGNVAYKARHIRSVVAVCRPHYKPKEEPVLKDDATGHWAEKAIRWEMNNHISNGYPDGSYRPNEPITRAEDATKLYRFCEMMEKEISELRAEIARLKEISK